MQARTESVKHLERKVSQLQDGNILPLNTNEKLTRKQGEQKPVMGRSVRKLVKSIAR